MQLFIADPTMSKKIFLLIFCPWKIEKKQQKSCSESAQTPFSHSPAQASALTSHIMKFRDQTSVLLCVSLSVIWTRLSS